MFERFTERARQVVVLAQDEARLLEHDYIGTEHLLLGLLREEEGLAARTLESLGFEVEQVRSQVVGIVGQGHEDRTTGQIPFMPRAKKVLELSLREAQALGHNFIDTQHLLLGLARENDGVAAQILREHGADADTVRRTVIGMLGGAPDYTPARGGLFAKPRRTYEYRGPSWWTYPQVSFVLGAVTLGIGILIGWAIWGA
jgi:ATP-dependent Clp protease ATP-binding subunit ClpC